MSWAQLFILSHQVVQQLAVLCTYCVGVTQRHMSQGELVELADLSLSQRRALTGGGEHPDHHQGAVQADIKIKTHNPALNQ